MIKINEVKDTQTISSIWNISQKDLSEKIQTIKDASERIKEIVNQSIENNNINEHKNQKLEKQIEVKLNSGKRLSFKEVNYLKLHNPHLYHLYLIVENKRKSVEEQLKHCKSKEEVQKVQENALESIGKNSPIKAMLISAINNTIEEYKKSDEYKKLPATEDDVKKSSTECNKVKEVIKDKSIKSIHDVESSTDIFYDGNENLEYKICFGKYQETYINTVSNKININSY